MQNLSGYKVQTELHVGSETRVLRAQGPAGEPLVLKRARSERPSPREIGRLLHEHAVLKELEKLPGLVNLLGLYELEGSPVLILEDPGARSLDRVLAERGKLTLLQALRIGLELAQTLDAVHQAGVIHKDVKPQNLLIDEALERVWLIDFGIASRLAFEATNPLIPEALEGTLAYISPEQTGRTARSLDARTDLYSLGVTLYEALSGRRPFPEMDALALVHAHLAVPPPPLESLVSGIPSVVSRIVERLLAKNPESRYQTAKGLAFDLQRTLEQLAERGQVQSFALGRRDFSPKLRLPQILVGRADEARQLTEAFARAARGDVEMLLIGGPSGIGKTALVRSVYREIAQAGRGLLLAGKHDQLGRSTPYAALTQAFGGLMAEVASSPKPVFEAWRRCIEQALGENARVLVDLIPELAWVIGQPPAVPDVPAEQAANRLRLSWLEFVRAVTDTSPPLVLFLDDMQWVDPASMELLKTLLTDVGRKHLLVIAAYRDNEAEASHPLWKLVEAVEKSGARTSRLSVGPLDETMMQTWLAVALSTETERVTTLARSLQQKTHGNPFFLGQLLLELYRRKHVRRNLETGDWAWDTEAIERASVTENVVELMRGRIGELPAGTQELLGQAACAGHSFSLAELSVLSEQSRAEVSQLMWPALQAGLVVPSDGQYRDAQALAQVRGQSALDARYQFLHDRVQQAFYERIAPAQRTRTHLHIGRRLEARFKQEGGSDQKLLELARHLNLGAPVLETETARHALAQLNLRAARAAKRASAFRVQASLLESAQALLGSYAWEQSPQLSVELSLERIEAAYMLREFEDVHRRALELLALPLPALPRLAAQELRVRACVILGEYAEGERLGLEALAEQGMTFPNTEAGCQAEAMGLVHENNAWLKAHPQGFDNMPLDSSPERMLIEALCAEMILCAGLGSRPTLGCLATLRLVQLSILRASLTPMSPFFVGSCAHAISLFTGQHREAVQWALTGDAAARRLDSPFRPVCAVYAGVFTPYYRPVEEALAHYHRSFQVARAAGAFDGMGFALLSEHYYVGVWGGRPLEAAVARDRAHRDLVFRAGEALGQHYFALTAGWCSFLQASGPAIPSESEEWLPVNSRSLQATGDQQTTGVARLLEAHLFLIWGQPQRALQRAEEANSFRAALLGMTPVTDIDLWLGLSAAKCYASTLCEAEQKKLRGYLVHGIERFRYLTEGCAENFGHKLRLLEAENARIQGRTDEALAAYDDAIDQAHAQGFLHIEALAAQFCAEFHMRAGRKRSASQYLYEACDAYNRWGADRILRYLRAAYPAFLHGPNRSLSGIPEPLPVSGETLSTSTSSATSTRTGSVQLDVGTAVRAAQTLSSELDLERVVARLMELVLENAGAQRASLLLGEADSLRQVARLDVEQSVRVATGLSVSLAECTEVSAVLIELIARSRQALVIPDMRADPRFARDAHLIASNTRSVLAAPLLHQGRLAGVLYLEHAEPDAFTSERAALVGVLASQSAIALENARLYADLQHASTELQKLNISLESQVAVRTAELERALSELWSEMDLAKKIQTVLLPPDGTYGGYEVAATMRPADQVGGDYYDVFEAHSRLWVLIGDVSGHGVSAGLIMMMVQMAVRTLLCQPDGGTLTPASLLASVNAALCPNLERIGRGQYMTLTALCLEGAKLRYAGLHLDPLIYRAETKRVERLEASGIWMGVVADARECLWDSETALSQGDVLLLYTDGLSEATRGGKLVDLDWVEACLGQEAQQGASSRCIVDRVFADLAGATCKDDVSVLALRNCGSLLCKQRG